MVSFTLRLFYSRGRPLPDTYLIGGLLNPRASTEVFEEINILLIEGKKVKFTLQHVIKSRKGVEV
jgi:hypothetical protein